MTFSEWINKVIESGNLCAEYTDKVHEAKSKKALMDIALDANGCKYLCEMDEKGFATPYDIITNAFGSYINGRYVAVYEGKNGASFSSSMYCCYEEDTCLVETDLVTFLCCSTNVFLKKYARARIIVDKNCNLTINCGEYSHCIVEVWGGAKVDVVGSVENVKIVNH